MASAERAWRLERSSRHGRSAPSVHGRLPPIRPRSWCAAPHFRWSGACTATLSGAVSAGSNPAEGTAQRHKFEHSGNLERRQRQRCDLRKRGRVPDLAPYTCPTAKGRTGELPAQQHHTLTVSRPKTGRCSCADSPAKRRWLQVGVFRSGDVTSHDRQILARGSPTSAAPRKRRAFPVADPPRSTQRRQTVSAYAGSAPAAVSPPPSGYRMVLR
jgi:hypothetical protein